MTGQMVCEAALSKGVTLMVSGSHFRDSLKQARTLIETGRNRWPQQIRQRFGSWVDVRGTRNRPSNN